MLFRLGGFPAVTLLAALGWMLPTTGVADMGQLTEVGHQILGSVALF